MPKKIIKKEKKPISKKTPPPSSRLIENLKKTLLQYMQGKRFRPMKQEDLFIQLKIPKSLHPVCKQVITDLISQKQIEVKQKLLSIPFLKENIMSGILRMHPKGFGFVIPDDPLRFSQDVFIPKHLTAYGVDGDHVEVLINEESFSEKGPEGKIVTIIKRARQHLAGTVRFISENKEISVYVPLLGPSKPVIAKPLTNQHIAIGDRVTLKVVSWGSEKEPTQTEISQIIGNINDPSTDIPAAIEEFDLCSAFPKSVVEQAKKYGKKVSLKELEKRVDLTKTLSLTIDPDTAKDFDDALSIEKDKKGNYHLGVHIADVAHYVKPNTPLDQEAILRANSTYFPGMCIPMLPEALSNELCSLKPKVIRATISVLMQFDKTGQLSNYKIVRSFIKSAKRFTYQEAKDVLDKKKKSPYLKQLQLMHTLCLVLKQKRNERGSIDFALPELVVIVDEKGEPQGMKKIEYDITHQLVEEFMLKANELVAISLHKKGKELIYRVHEDPQEENFNDFLKMARMLGFKVPLEPSPQDLQQLFEKARSTAFFTQLSVAFIRSMKLAQYSPENVGHYGLALDYYCHFTSPIRRYSDLIIQRLLFDEEPEDLNIQKIADQCSERERISFRAEMSVKTLKKLRLLKRYQEEDPNRSFAAIITKIKPFGVYFELQEMLFEGFLHISELHNDYFIFDEKSCQLFGRHTGITYRLGHLIELNILKIDLILLEVKWDLYETHSQNRPSQKRGKKGKKKE